MSEATTVDATTGDETGTEHFDVLIVGAGISGIGAAYHLLERCPGKQFVMLDSMDSFGGTWHTHRYPGIRSDSDLFTFGYSFKPWTGAPIATGDEILSYLDETIEQNDLEQYIRFGHLIETATWSSDTRQWTISGTHQETGEAVTFTCDFLWMCQGYYRHADGYTPEWPGMERFQGTVVHPQTWPEDLDYRDKSVVVIGSGATAATLIPAMADETSHITMLQRSPTYFAVGRNANELADTLRELDIPDEWTHEIVRQKILHDSKVIADMSFDQPEVLKAELIKAARELLGPDFDVETHFTPRYRPWQQRLAFLPDGDLFHGIREGKASVVTDKIAAFTETGIELESGEVLEADIIVTATGFNLCQLGDIEFSVDGRALDVADTFTYRGIMFSDVPNMAQVFGYLRTSWTMRSDLISDFVCRLLNHMEAKGAAVVTPRLREEDLAMTPRPFIEPDNFNAGYITRGVHAMPKQGDHAPWVFLQDYYAEKDDLPGCDLDDGSLWFE